VHGDEERVALRLDHLSLHHEERAQHRPRKVRVVYCAVHESAHMPRGRGEGA
jgi:hypothetical protein